MDVHNITITQCTHIRICIHIQVHGVMLVLQSDEKAKWLCANSRLHSVTHAHVIGNSGKKCHW